MYDSDFDKQKLYLHPERVCQFLKIGKTTGPLYTEMELSNRCNHHCFFCGVDYIVNKNGVDIDPVVAKRAIDQCRNLGNKSIMFSGHGEPMLHPQALEIISYGSSLLSASVTTNGSALSEEKLPLIDGLKWIRFSVNGTDPENYRKIHNTGSDVFNKVLGHIEAAVARKNRKGLGVTIGVQLVLLPENWDGVLGLARRCREMGVDYFSVKPFSQHPLSKSRVKVDYSKAAELEEKLKGLKRDGFKIAFRAQAMNNAGKKKTYGKCYGTHFLNFISATGEVWECNDFAGDPRFYIGNINDESMEDIWTGNRREKVLEALEKEIDLSQCRYECRMNECNKYIWRLNNPLEHDDFI